MDKLRLNKFDGETEVPEGDWEEGEPPTQPIQVMDRDLTTLLLSAAVGHERAKGACRGCDECHRFGEMWDFQVNRLPHHLRMALLVTMVDAGIDYPGLLKGE